MRAIITLIAWCVLVSSGRLFGQVFATNNGVVVVTNTISQAEAIKVASRLRVGMREEDVVRVLATNRLYSTFSLGAMTGWTSFYTLSNGCSLGLDYIAREVRGGGHWGGNGALRKACIQSNCVNIISIALTNAPYAL